MPTALELAWIVTANPGPLPAPARDLVVDVALTTQPVTSGLPCALCDAVLARAEVSAADARRIWERFDDPDIDTQAAWLARPEHPIQQMPDLVAEQLNRHTVPVLDGSLVSLLIHQPLCRPQVPHVLLAAGGRVADAARWALAEQPSVVTVDYTPDTARVRALRLAGLATQTLAWRSVGAEHLVTALGDNPDAWRVLCATVDHLPATATLDDVVTIVTGVCYAPSASDGPSSSGTP